MVGEPPETVSERYRSMSVLPEVLDANNAYAASFGEKA
jgi:hypothetical protein